MDVVEKDWKLYKKKLAIWQENYMDRLNKHYIELLNTPNENPSTLFWKLYKEISHDKNHPGVRVELRRSNMHYTILRLLNDKIITFSDLDEFSDELKDDLRSMMR